MITITWNNFDKAFWLTAKNMRNLIGFSISFGSSINDLESRQDKAETDIQKNQQDIITNIQNTNTVASTANQAARDVADLDRRFTGFVTGYDLDIQEIYNKIAALQEVVNEHYAKYPI